MSIQNFGKYQTFTGYRRNNSDGTLSMVDVDVLDGVLDLQLTDEVVALLGWPDAGQCVVALTDGGVEVLLPVASLAKLGISYT